MSKLIQCLIGAGSKRLPEACLAWKKPLRPSADQLRGGESRSRDAHKMAAGSLLVADSQLFGALFLAVPGLQRHYEERGSAYCTW